ncbi:MAG: beta-N-acetylhexosaminidase [Oligoflexus sp.]
MPADAASAVLLAAFEGCTLSSDEQAFFQEEGVAGVTLFKRNIPSNYADLQESVQYLQSLNSRREPLLIAIDQEGGRVARLAAPFPNLGPVLNIHTEAAPLEVFLSNYGFVVGSVLRGLGVNFNFAPVCDVLSRDDNEAIGDRCFGRDVTAVVKKAGAFLRGMEQAGIWGCLKHFPGQGDANFDTHEGSAVVQTPAELLRERELQPFQQLMGLTRPIMVSHAIYPAIDDKPASLSGAWMQEILRNEMGFQGLLVSDDMNMKAIPQADGDWEAALIESVMAGIDLLLVCRGLDRCQRALIALRDEAAKSAAFRRRLEEAADRVMDLRRRL